MENKTLMTISIIKYNIMKKELNETERLYLNACINAAKNSDHGYEFCIDEIVTGLSKQQQKGYLSQLQQKGYIIKLEEVYYDFEILK